MSVNDYVSTQKTFTQRIRTPKQAVLPAGVDAARMQVYEDLLFDTIYEILSANFPVLFSVLGEEQSLALTRLYYANHQAQTPYFYRIAEEFLSYLQAAPYKLEQYPFLLELAHYEWVELALAVAEDPDKDKQLEDFKTKGQWHLSPLCWLLVYAYPVHEISADNIYQQTPLEPTYLAIYRDRAHKVNFMQLNVLTARLLDVIKQAPGLSLTEYIDFLQKDFGKLSTEQEQGAAKFLQDCLQSDMVYTK